MLELLHLEDDDNDSWAGRVRASRSWKIGAALRRLHLAGREAGEVWHLFMVALIAITASRTELARLGVALGLARAIPRPCEQRTREVARRDGAHVDAALRALYGRDAPDGRRTPEDAELHLLSCVIEWALAAHEPELLGGDRYARGPIGGEATAAYVSEVLAERAEVEPRVMTDILLAAIEAERARLDAPPDPAPEAA